DPATTDAVGAEWSDVTIESADVHGFSSDGAAVCFADSSGTRYSYLSTAADAAINNADLSNGYTLETFVKLDEDWDASQNGWSKALVRTGNRSETSMPPSQWDYTASPTALGISNLREFQYTSLSKDASKGDRVNWSGEIMTGSWSHVAIVNDPETKTTTMYVDAAPVLRNAIDTAGMTWNEGMPWILGSDWTDDAARNGWHGCIGETRIIDRATTPDEWLTQRADLSGLDVAVAPNGTLPAGTETAEFSGTGFPGADIVISTSTQAAASPAARLATAAASAPIVATVNADGTWSFALSDLTAGAYDVSIAQALGLRTSDAVSASFEILATPTDPDEPGEGSGEETPVEQEPGAGAGSGPGSVPDDAALPATGLDGALWITLLAAAGALLAGGGLIALRARRRLRD